MRARLAEAGRPRVVTLRVFADNYSLRLSPILDALDVPGKRAAPAEFAVDYSLERVGDFDDADVILLFVDVDAAEQARRLVQSPLFQRLPAARNGRVAEVDTGIWYGIDLIALNRQLDDVERHLLGR